MSEEAPQPTIVMENRQGQRVDVPVAEARQRFDAGELGFPRDVPLGVYTEDGGVRALTAEQAPRIFRQGGQVLPTSDARELVASQYNREEEQRVQRDLQQEYGGAGSQALTAAEGFVSEATFGLAPALLGGLSPEYRRRQAASQSHHKGGVRNQRRGYSGHWRSFGPRRTGCSRSSNGPSCIGGGSLGEGRLQIYSHGAGGQARICR